MNLNTVYLCSPSWSWTCGGGRRRHRPRRRRRRREQLPSYSKISERSWFDLHAVLTNVEHSVFWYGWSRSASSGKFGKSGSARVV